MVFIKRRRFLQFAGSTLAATGLSQADFFRKASRYHQVAAQTPARKLALLIGINDYSENSAAANLRGCLTDVDLQYELLVHRFGFNPDDIIKITDDQPLKPTRNNILDTFRSHLIDQANPGDVVVFHYSGHGSRVFDPDPVYEGSALNGTIVPNDPVSADSEIVPDIMGRTLFLLMRSLKTNNVTAILDSCHSGGGLRGNAVVRAVRESRVTARAMPDEFELQTHLLKSANLSFEAFQQERAAGVAKGVGMGSAQLSQLAFDIPHEGFYSGAFTYLLTRYLWQMPGGTPVNRIRANLVRSTQLTVAAAHNNLSQIPQFQVAPESNGLAQPIYFTPSVRGSAEAVVTEVAESGEIVFWLGGVSSQTIALTETQAGFTVLNERREAVGEIKQTKRFGLIGVGERVSGQAMPGMLMRETVVGLPADLSLKIGVDSSLGAQVTAAVEQLSKVLISAQTGRSQIIATPVDQQTPYDYILGRSSEARRTQLTADGFETALLPPVDSLLLFTPALEPVPLSDRPASETIADAVENLRLRFKVLLANKVIRALAAVKTELAVTGAIYAESDSSRSASIRGVAEETVETISTTFKAGETYRIRIKNNESNQPVYVSCLAIQPDGNMTVIYPNDWSAPEDAALIEPNAEIVLPRPEDQQIRYAFVLDEDQDSDIAEIVTLVSVRPLRSMLKALQEISSSRGNPQQTSISLRGGELNFLETILADVNQASRGDRTETNKISAESTAVDGRAIAVFSTLVETTRF